MKLSIIIPVYNEEKTIEEIIGRVNTIDLGGVKKEIVVVNDGSTDKTSVKLEDLKKKIKDMMVVFCPENQGKGSAVRVGLSKASGDYVLIQDADLEYDPKYIKKLLGPIIEKKTQVVYGTRLKRLPNIRKEERRLQFLLHYFGNRFLSFITSILYGSWITDMETCYKLFPREEGKNLHLTSRGFEFEPEITAKFLKRGYKIVEIPISTSPRGYEEGKKLNTISDGIMSIWTLIKYRLIN